jgi:NAD(P)-dependent dehydrogenase (short-subunit alcohol dehydrogenase family)
MDIRGAVVVVTGAPTGIGATTARATSRAGALVAPAARREEHVRRRAEELGDALAVPRDLTDPPGVLTLMPAATDANRRIDVFVNHAGAGDDRRRQSRRLPRDPHLNLVAPLIVMQAVIPVMRKQGAGTIFDVSSAMTFLTIPGSGAHAASKAGLEKCSLIARAELAEAGVTFLLTRSRRWPPRSSCPSVRCGVGDAVALSESDRVQTVRRRLTSLTRSSPADGKQRRASTPDARGVGATRSRPDMP